MEVVVNLVNSGRRMSGLPATYMVEGGRATLSFHFLDVDATVTEEGGGRLSGTFTSSRDHGRYVATARSDQDDNARRYEGHWHNEDGRRGDFFIEWQCPRAQTPRASPAQANELFVSFGTREELVVLVPDRSLFGDGGRTIQDMYLKNMHARGIRIPQVTGHEVWSSWKKEPEGCGDRVRVNELKRIADFIFAAFLRPNFSDVWHVTTPDRDYDVKDINVYSKGGSKGLHQDSQPYGSLVLVFCAGLACQSSVRLKNGQRREVEMRSGDCMIFEGKTWHQVRECMPGTSPFERDEWLADRRLSILCRQRPPKSWMRVPR